jgi:peptidoglycan/xylan/chitin deacetylase (PgdA/CDA1 family)
MTVPFGERGGAARGVIDLVCGRLPGFVFGGAVGSCIPVFHFHDERRDSLDSKFRYLRENGYRTLRADELSAVARGQRPVGDREVGLCFDDAWSSVWTDAAPLLREYGLTAIVYPIPGRVADARGVRQVDAPVPGVADGFMTWPEIRSLHAEGLIDVQSHTWLHARVFTSATALDFVRPGYEHGPPLNRPLVTTEPEPAFIDPSELGAPLFEHRSRMSDGLRLLVPPDAHAACVALVRSEGGAAFFTRTDWRNRLEKVVEPTLRTATFEHEDERRRAIEAELDRSRAELNARLGTNTVRHVCLPWGVSGAATVDALQRLGFESAIANRWTGSFAVRPGDHPFWLKRLPNKFVFALPGQGRRTMFTQVLGR